MTQTIGLAMLVKDEEQALPATLQRILPVIDAWTVLDTGSTDQSRQIVSERLSGLPGELVEQPFKGFGPSRTALLQAAADKADYTLMLDADMTLNIHGDRPALTADAYTISLQRNDLHWRLPLLTKSSHPFQYVGVAHSYLHSDQPTRIEPTDWLSADPGPGCGTEKLDRDRALFEAEIKASDTPDPRSVFYLAQTYRDLGQTEKAIAMYRLRTEMGGWDEEVYYARYQLGCLLSDNISFAQGASELLEAWYRRPHRAESLRALARAANSVADKLELPDDALFVDPRSYGPST